uniref:Pre-mRNA-splicing factor 38 n=1 Tax=Populus alba TaxID=43335 RepID=A0A4V6AB72_POPAL|nr:hypothetical protein D5086_0000049880 [Populus alba]
MANRTDPAAKNIKGTNPQNLVEKILRSKNYQHTYWKEQCFGLTAETIVDGARSLRRYLWRKSKTDAFYVLGYEDYSCDIVLPRIKIRWTLETLGALETTKCVLEDDFEKEEEREENEQLDGLDNGADERDYCHERSPARERDRDTRRDSCRYGDHDYDRERGQGRERDSDRDRDRYRLRDERDYGSEGARKRKGRQGA